MPASRAFESALTASSRFRTFASVETSTVRLRHARRRRTSSGECGIFYVDKRKVAAARAACPSGEEIDGLGERFGALANPTRLRILHALSRAELCVCDLSKLAGRSMPATSQQLQFLRRLGLVKYRMDGKLAYYTLADDWVRTALAQALQRLRADARR